MSDTAQAPTHTPYRLQLTFINARSARARDSISGPPNSDHRLQPPEVAP